MKGKVFLVGAGPGDEGLITVKGLQKIKEADVIVYDYLANERLLRHGKCSCEKIFVGKQKGLHSASQEEIHSILIQKAQEGKQVVRLKGGDPFVFGRGGEEAEALQKVGIHFEIIPGISSSIAVPAYGGIPVTHRGVSSSFHVITGHESEQTQKEALDYEVLAKLSGTLVFLMGIHNLTFICGQLIKYGKSPETPIGVISRGTTPEQNAVISTLGEIEKELSTIQAPGIIVIGEVVRLRDQVQWFEQLPLFGRKILVTRAQHQQEELSAAIEAAGGRAVQLPTIIIEPKLHTQEVKEMYSQLSAYDWIIFTSTNGVELFFRGLREYHGDIRTLGNARICAIGSATKKALEDRYLHVELMPEEHVGEALIEKLKAQVQKGEKVLIPRAEEARTLVPEVLKEMGAEVEVISLYKTLLPMYAQDEVLQAVCLVDTLTFTSSSTVRNFMQLLGKDDFNLLAGKKIVCIGPITGNTAEEAGLSVDKVAGEFNMQGLLQALMEETHGTHI